MSAPWSPSPADLTARHIQPLSCRSPPKPLRTRTSVIVLCPVLAARTLLEVFFETISILVYGLENDVRGFDDALPVSSGPRPQLAARPQRPAPCDDLARAPRPG